MHISLLCVSSMSIYLWSCNFKSREILFVRVQPSVTHRFDTMTQCQEFRDTLKLSSPVLLPPTHTTYTHREREGTPPLSRSERQTWIENVCMSVCVWCITLYALIHTYRDKIRRSSERDPEKKLFWKHLWVRMCMFSIIQYNLFICLWALPSCPLSLFAVALLPSIPFAVTGCSFFFPFWDSFFSLPPTNTSNVYRLQTT